MGQAYLNLKKVLTGSRDVLNSPVPVTGKQGESLGTLFVSLIALDVLSALDGGGGSSSLRSERLPARGASGASAGGGSSASKFVGSFSESGGDVVYCVWI